MPGIPTQFTVADEVLDRLRTSGSTLVPSDGNLPFFYLGAIGPTLGDFLPSRPEIKANEPNSRLFVVWLPIVKLLAGSPVTPGIYPTLLTVRDILSRFRLQSKRGVDGNPAEKDLAKLALLNMKGDLESLPGLIDTMTKQFGQIQSLTAVILPSILSAGPKAKVPPSRDWRPRDTLHQSLTGRFLAELRQRADASGDARLQAFAAGATVGYGSALCANPFVNGVVGGPHRNHWWRHRFIANYIDAWVFGYYATRRRLRVDNKEVVVNATTQEPVPAYTDWDNACGANLQRRIEIGGISVDAVLNAVRDDVPLPGFLPPEVADLWIKSFEAVYGTRGGKNGVDTAGLQSSYGLTWFTLWMSTSAEFLTCTPPDRVNFPDSCGDRPDYVAQDGSVVLPGGQVIKPPSVGRPKNPSIAEEASGVVLALLGALLSITGVFTAAGIALIVAGVASFADGATDPDWSKLHCHAEWVSVYLTNLENALRQMLVAAGLGVPYTAELAHNPIALQVGGVVVGPWAALNSCRSPVTAEAGYPRSVWNPGPKSTWTSYPTEPPEAPSGSTSYPGGQRWPYHFVDGIEAKDNGAAANPRFTFAQINPVTSSEAGIPQVLDAATFNSSRDRLPVPDSFRSLWGNAVDVSLALLAAKPDQLLNWDLDGDRAIGFPTWVGSPSAPSPE